MKATPKKLMLAALLALAPAGVAFAAQDCSADAHASYYRGLGGDDPGYLCVQGATWQTGAAGPSGPVISADMACGRDPFEGTWRAFNTGGPAQLCGLMVTSQQTGAQGPAGPIMSSEQTDAFYRYDHIFPGD